MSIAFMHCVMLWTIVKIMQVQKLETQYNAKYTLHKKGRRRQAPKGTQATRMMMQ
jgi:hypothetical protein